MLWYNHGELPTSLISQHITTEPHKVNRKVTICDKPHQINFGSLLAYKFDYTSDKYQTIMTGKTS